VIWTERPDRPGRFDRLHLQPYPGGDSKVRYGYATAADQGVQVVGWVQNSLFGQRGTFWDNDPNHTLALPEPAVPGDWTSMGLGVNDLGQAVGVSYPSAHAVLWLDDAAHTPVDLGTLPGDVQSIAAGINVHGRVIGTSYAADGTPHAFVWQNGAMAGLGSLLDVSGVDWVTTSVTAINNAGQIAGSGLYQGQPQTFLMTPAGRTRRRRRRHVNGG
jgi:probable HAF family extracellular repeat protein